jgi:hypothetical protein
MSSDPNVEPSPEVRTEGDVIRQPLFTKSGGDLTLVDLREGTGAPRIADQKTIPPFRKKIHSAHPCYDLNKELGKCSDKQPAEMLLAARCAVCYKERQALQQCFAASRKWKAPPPSRPWWQLWSSSE